MSPKKQKSKIYYWTERCPPARESVLEDIFALKVRKNNRVTQKNANKHEKSVDFVSKKVYSIQALNERASQISQRNEKSTDRKKKVLDRMTHLWYSN